MIYTEMTKKAMKIAYDAHAGQEDKCGTPYIFHPMHLAEQMESEDTCTVALLHDVVEDTQLSIADLKALGFPKGITDAILLLTHDRAEPYLDYVKRVRINPAARAVKLADLKHNSDTSRLESVDEKTIERIAKYRRAIEILEANT